MECFSQGSMKRNPLIQGSIFSSYRLHARIILESSRQVSLSLDLWHAHLSLDFIKNHQPETVEIIPHIYLASLTSHISSRSCRHIQLNCFRVSLLFMSRALFLSLFAFCFVWVLSTCFQWELAVVLMYVSLKKHYFSFHSHLTTFACMTLLLHEWSSLWWLSSHTCMLSRFFESCTFCLHELSFTVVCTHITMHSDFSCFQSPVAQTGLPRPWPYLA